MSTKLDWLLLVLGLLLVLIMGAFVYIRWGRPEMSLSRGLSGGGETAREALPLAYELASQWQEDARLAVVSGQRSSARMKKGDVFSWAFQFYSPAAQRMALITVTDGRARIVRDVQTLSSLATFSVAEWEVDSDEALQVWWENGGEAMVRQYPETMLAMQLRVDEELGGDLVWRVSGLVTATEETLTVVVDAASGALVG